MLAVVLAVDAFCYAFLYVYILVFVAPVDLTGCAKNAWYVVYSEYYIYSMHVNLHTGMSITYTGIGTYTLVFGQHSNVARV